mgnify:CR=1 FL=1
MIELLVSRTPEARAGYAHAVLAPRGGMSGCSTGGRSLLRYTVEQVYDSGSTCGNHLVSLFDIA